MPTAPKKCQRCGEPVRLVRNISTGKWVPIDQAYATPREPAALVMVGSVAYSQPVDAIQRVCELLGVPEADAATEVDAYPWHLNHRSHCRQGDHVSAEPLEGRAGR